MKQVSLLSRSHTYNSKTTSTTTTETSFTFKLQSHMHNWKTTSSITPATNVTFKQNYRKTETCKLYSGVLWIFLPNVIKIGPYNFELYRFKVGAFFSETQCSTTNTTLTTTTTMLLTGYVYFGDSAWVEMLRKAERSACYQRDGLMTDRIVSRYGQCVTTYVVYKYLHTDRQTHTNTQKQTQTYVQTCSSSYEGSSKG